MRPTHFSDRFRVSFRLHYAGAYSVVRLLKRASHRTRARGLVTYSLRLLLQAPMKLAVAVPGLHRVASDAGFAKLVLSALPTTCGMWAYVCVYW